MSYLPETNKQYYRYLSLLAVVILGVVSILGSGGGGDSTPPPPTAPSVVVFPAQDSDTALVTTEVLARFSERMEPLTVNNNSFLLRDSIQDITGTVTFYAQYNGQDNVAVFVPNTDLDVSEEYFATLTTEMTSTSGIPLSRDYNWSFFIAPSLVPVSTDGAGNFGNAGINTLSPSAPNATGEYIVFASEDNLTGVPTGGRIQIYRKNTVTGRIELVSTTSNNQTVADGPCANPRINDTGRYVVFASTANNLDPLITNLGGFSHIYLKDMRDGTISLLDVNFDNPGQAGNGDSSRPDISGIPDAGSGKYVVFESAATNLLGVGNDTNGLRDIFLINVVSGAVELISITTDDNPSNGPSYWPRVSENGQRVVFESDANNLLGVGNDTNGLRDIFLRNLNATTTSLISVASGGGAANGPSNSADISADGNYIVFQSAASNLVAGDGISRIDIFLRNLTGNVTTWLSANTAGNEANGDSILPSINEDGHHVAFTSGASDLVSTDPNGTVSDVFVRNTQPPGTIELLSLPLTLPNNQGSGQNATISADGRYVSFTTPYAFDTADGNGVNDIYRAYNSALP